MRLMNGSTECMQVAFQWKISGFSRNTGKLLGKCGLLCYVEGGRQRFGTTETFLQGRS